MRRDDLLGTWHLESYVSESDGAVDEPLGPGPVGIIMYTDDGYMSAQLMRRDRPAHATAASGYLCYSGPFTVDEAASVVSHHVEVSLLPNWVGGTQVRHGRLDNGALVLRAEITSRSGASTAHVLTWRRAPRDN